MSAMLEFLREAQEDVEEASRFYERQTSGLGARFRAEVENASTAIVRNPLLWRERAGGYRRVNLPGFPYYIVYFVRGERIIIAVIGHVSRHPNYWKWRKLRDRPDAQ